ncbi:hypothetical protein Dsin_015033 [Dipteronia sinensis]|uniref:RNase H type-1 domain-containing protein n=1 Tax=Dipteronia sinensis TaxID=43782 RepID=A0AAE0EAC9_9ROSI|nr:hypothetical protein Dsin_015033 [Dipteronia sinensis]
MDGSSRGNPGAVGIGGVLRDNSGKVLRMFSEFVGILSSNSAELLAIHRSDSLCANSTFFYGKDLDFVSDSKVVDPWINSEGLGSLNHVQLIYDIWVCLNSLRNGWVIFNTRSSNSFADQLVKKGSGHEGNVLFRDFQ